MNRPFVHGLADVKSDAIGAGTRIWQFVVVLSGAKIGYDCNICSHCLIENDVVTSDRAEFYTKRRITMHRSMSVALPGMIAQSQSNGLLTTPFFRQKTNRGFCYEIHSPLRRGWPQQAIEVFVGVALPTRKLPGKVSLEC